MSNKRDLSCLSYKEMYLISKYDKEILDKCVNNMTPKSTENLIVKDSRVSILPSTNVDSSTPDKKEEIRSIQNTDIEINTPQLLSCLTRKKLVMKKKKMILYL